MIMSMNMLLLLFITVDTSDVHSMNATVVGNLLLLFSVGSSMDQMLWDARWYWSATVQISVMHMHANISMSDMSASKQLTLTIFPAIIKWCLHLTLISTLSVISPLRR